MAPHRQMQMLVTRFERLSRRISLAGLASGHQAVKAISEGRVLVDGKVATSNFKIFSEAVVTMDGHNVPPPDPLPKLWALNKPRKVLCEAVEKEGVDTLPSLMRRWRERQHKKLGDAQSIGLLEESLENRHFIVVTGVPYNGQGLVLMTNDGLFAQALQDHSSNILSIFDLRIAGDPSVEMLHKWRRGARAGGINFGQVFCSITSRTSQACKLRLRMVESPKQPLSLLLEHAKIRVHRFKRYGFGPYMTYKVPDDVVVQLPIHKSLMSLVPKADMRQALVPTRGGVLSPDGRLRAVNLEGSVIAAVDQPEAREGAEPPAEAEVRSGELNGIADPSESDTLGAQGRGGPNSGRQRLSRPSKALDRRQSSS